MSQGIWIAIAVIAVLVVIALVVGLVRYRRSKISLQRPPEAATPIDRSGSYTAASGITFTQSSEPGLGIPNVGDDAAVPRDSPKRPIAQVHLPEPPVVDETIARDTGVLTPTVAEAPAVPDVGAIAPAVSDVGAIAPAVSDVGAIAPPAGRLERLRGRLAKSQNAFGRSMLGLLGGGDLDESSWEEVEDTLLIADLGPAVTASVMEKLRSALAAGTVRSEADARAVLREVLIGELHPGFDRSIKALPHADKPSVLLVVGVNGTGKTTTVGKLARVLVADGRRVVL
ncbi:MAG TPA: signal recognition particle receptor subunit alpha, partial [Mycobacterium sp.]|nr:signal recognition particle receptor subunit alpha [Mycobacterium sp.]